MVDETNPHDHDSAEERREANYPDIGGPSWSESARQGGNMPFVPWLVSEIQKQREADQLEREAEAQIRQTLNSAILRGVIPDIWNLPKHDGIDGDDGLNWFLYELAELSLGQRQQVDANVAFSDDELQRAWHRVQKSIDETQRQIAKKMYADAVESGRLPSPETTDPDLFRRYSIALSELPHQSPIVEYEKAWEQVKTEWETTKKAKEIGAEPIRSKSSADNTKPKGQRGMKVGTDARVREMHRLLKKGLSQRQAKSQAHCDPSTYYHRCLEATGEEPIQPYR